MKVLILTYYFPPNNATAGFRPLSWAKEFVKNGIEPVVVTRHWNAEDNTQTAFRSYNYNKVKETNEDGYSIFSLPYTASRKRNIGEKILKKSSFLRKAYYLIITLFGHLDIDLDGRHAFKNFVSGYLKNNKIDLIIVTCPPFNLLRLAYELKAQFNIPFVADFRDLWNNNELNSNFKYGFVDGIFFCILKKHIANWLKSAFLVTVATTETGDKIIENGYVDKPITIFNGFETHFFENPPIGIKGLSFKNFTISCVGTLYPELDLSVFIDGFNLFINQNPSYKVEARFIGAGVNEEIVKKLTEKIPSSYLYVSQRVKRSEAIAEVKGANILFFPGFIGFKGRIVTKIFDYMASEKNILIAPGDDSTYESFLAETKAGISADTPVEVCDLLNIWYRQWENNLKIEYKGDKDKIKFYSRENQASIMIKHIMQNLVG